MKNTKFKRVKSRLVEEIKVVFKFGQKYRCKWQALI